MHVECVQPNMENKLEMLKHDQQHMMSFKTSKSRDPMAHFAHLHGPNGCGPDGCHITEASGNGLDRLGRNGLCDQKCQKLINFGGLTSAFVTVIQDALIPPQLSGNWQWVLCALQMGGITLAWAHGRAIQPWCVGGLDGEIHTCIRHSVCAYIYI